jgi:hypothetical protein
MPLLQNGVYRRIAPGPLLKSNRSTSDEVLTGAHDCRMAQIKATLFNEAQHSQESFLVQAKVLLFMPA